MCALPIWQGHGPDRHARPGDLRRPRPQAQGMKHGYHHGNLRQALVEAALALIAAAPAAAKSAKLEAAYVLLAKATVRSAEYEISGSAIVQFQISWDALVENLSEQP